MRKHISLILSAALLLMSQGVFASASNNDDADGESKPSVTSTHKRSREEEVDPPSSKKAKIDDLKCYRVVDEVTGEFLDKRINVGDPSVPVVVTPQDSQEKIVCGHKTWFQTLSQPVGLASLHFNVQLEILQYLDPESQNHLLRTCLYYRAFAQPVDGQDHANVPHGLRIDLLMTSIAKQSWDLELFMRDQRSTFRAQRSDDRQQARRNQIQRIDYLREAIASRYYNGTLSPKTKHGQTYGGIGPESINPYGWLMLTGRALRLVPLNFEGVERVTRLYLSDNQLRIAPNLSGLTRLGILDLSNNQLSVALVLSGLTALTRLCLSNNKLTLPPVVSGLMALEFLDLSGNKLTEPPIVTGLTGLQSLDLSRNKLTLPPVVSGLMALEFLDLSGNLLRDAPGLSGLRELQFLNLSGNQLRDAPGLSGLRALQWLNLSGNQLTVTPTVTGLMELERLDLSGNQLRDAPGLSGLRALQWLNLSGNLLRIAPRLLGLTALKILNLSGNLLTLPPAVSGLRALKWLYLDAHLCTNQTLLKTLRELNEGRTNEGKIIFGKVSKDSEEKVVITHVDLD